MQRPVWISPSGIEWSLPQATEQITAGSTWYFQFWFRDPAAGARNVNLSNGLAATFCP
jgi:hypothetical protein